MQIHSTVHKNTIVVAHHKSTSGFTLLEVLVTVTIAAILLSVAIPSMQETLRRNRIEGESQRLSGLLMQARNLAMTSNGQGFVCRSTQAQTSVQGAQIRCLTGAMSAGDTDWRYETMVYSILPDTTRQGPNNRFQNQRIQSIEGNNNRRKQMLKAVNEQPNANLTVTANRDDLVIRFNADGTLENQAPFRIAVCDNGAQQDKYGTIIEINASGQIRRSAIENSDTDRGCTPTTAT